MNYNPGKIQCNDDKSHKLYTIYHSRLSDLLQIITTSKMRPY